MTVIPDRNALLNGDCFSAFLQGNNVRILGLPEGGSRHLSTSVLTSVINSEAHARNYGLPTSIVWLEGRDYGHYTLLGVGYDSGTISFFSMGPPHEVAVLELPLGFGSIASLAVGQPGKRCEHLLVLLGTGSIIRIKCSEVLSTFHRIHNEEWDDSVITCAIITSAYTDLSQSAQLTQTSKIPLNLFEVPGRNETEIVLITPIGHKHCGLSMLEIPKQQTRNVAIFVKKKHEIQSTRYIISRKIYTKENLDERFGILSKYFKFGQIEWASKFICSISNDQPRRYTKVIFPPCDNGDHAASLDSLGRVLLINLYPLYIIRIWKGYRNAQIGWISAVHKDSLPLLVIYAPLKFCVEVYTIPVGALIYEIFTGDDDGQCFLAQQNFCSFSGESLEYYRSNFTPDCGISKELSFQSCYLYCESGRIINVLLSMMKSDK